jgi:hypothetical protein
MKVKMSLLCAVAAVFALSANAAAIFVPDSEVSENLDGKQQIIKIYTLAPEENPDALIEEAFDREGFRYTFASITKSEQQFSDKRIVSDTATVNTEKDDLGTVLDALAPTLDYDSGGYSGTLALDHTSIVTEATGYTIKYYTYTDTKTYDNLDRNDPSYVPQTTVKNGRTLTLSNIEWSVQGTSVSDDTLVPTSYLAVATYSGTGSGKTADGYVTTAVYSGEVTSDGVKSITYTVTYFGDPLATQTQNPSRIAFPRWAVITAIIAAVLCLGGAVAVTVRYLDLRRRNDNLSSDYWDLLDDYIDVKEPEEIE